MTNVLAVVAINRFNVLPRSQVVTANILTDGSSSIASNTILRTFTNYNWLVINDSTVIDR